MRSRAWTFTSRALLALAFVAGLERGARAQACCVAPGAAGVSRLAPDEAALAGLDARATSSIGSLDANGRYRPNPPGTRDLALEQRVFGALRVLGRGQVAVSVPFLENAKASGADSATGGGLGDVAFAARGDLLHAGGSWPGLALLAGVSAPTGRPPERASDPFGAGATGAGTTQGWGGLAVEHVTGPWLYGGTVTATLRASRDVGGVHSSLAPRLTTALIGAHAWTSGSALSLGASWEIEDRARVNGAIVGGSARRALRLTTALQLPLVWQTRLVGSIFAVPPVPAVSAGEAASIGLSIALIRPWS